MHREREKEMNKWGGKIKRHRVIDIHVRALLSASHTCRSDRREVSRFFMGISHLCLMKDIKVAGHSWEAEEGGTHVETGRDTNGRMFSQFCDRMYAHIHKLHNDPAKTSWATDVIKCWQDCCVHYSNAAMQSQRWVFRTMSSLINQTEALTMLPRWVSCCSLDVRENIFGKLTATVYWKSIFNPHFPAFPLARDEEVALQEAEVLWCYNKDELCCCLWFWCLAEFDALWPKKTPKNKWRHVELQNPKNKTTDNCKLLCLHILKKTCGAFKAS